jgi:HAD superfamily hydrolase (TIGR01509 family)
MTVELVIFDCDGVLVDSEPIVNRIHAAALTACGFRITEKDLLDRFCGTSDADMLATIERELGRPLPASYVADVAAQIAGEYRRALRPIRGIAAVLDNLRLPVCVASSSTPEQLRLGLEAAGLHRYFADRLFSAAMVAHSKPAPDLFLHAAEAMGADPERCLVIEDSLHGIDAALAAGMTAIGFCGGSHCRPGHAARLLARGAAAIAEDAAQLAARLAEFTGR